MEEANLNVKPVFDYPSNISIPSSSWDEAQSTGSYTWTVNYPANIQFVALMSDSTGIAVSCSHSDCGVSEVDDDRLVEFHHYIRCQLPRRHVRCVRRRPTFCESNWEYQLIVGFI